MLQFWRNPEFIRHVRAELRPARAVTVVVVVFFLCALIGLGCWAQQKEIAMNLRAYGASGDVTPDMLADVPRQGWLLFARWVIGLQGGLLTFWSLFACAQSVSGERDRKTWDFQRTTSLTPAELVMGKLLGEPVLAYFGALCALPVGLVAGFSGGLSFGTLASVYVSLLVISLFLGLGGLWLSTLLESRSRGIGMIGALAFYGFVVGTAGFAASWFPGLAAFSPLTAVHSVFGPNFMGRVETPTLFGQAVPWLLVTLLLCASFGAWLTLMLVRNLKRDYDEIRPLSRWQAVGFAAFLNFTFYALLVLQRSQMRSGDLATFMVSINAVILFVVGLATLTPHERLKVWWRARAAGNVSMFSEDGLPWPWMALSAVVAYALMVWGLLAWRLSLDFHVRSLAMAAVQLLVVLVFITRDILFIQWCTLTRLRQPVVKGSLFLGLYYGAAGIVTLIFSVSSAEHGIAAMRVLTPAGIFDQDVQWSRVPTSVYGGLALQIGLIAVILVAIGNRLARPTLAPVASGD